MTPLEEAQFAYDTGRFYQTIARQIGDFIHEHISDLSDRELSIISDDQTRLISYSNTFFSLTTDISFDGAAPYFLDVKNATTQITDALGHIQSVSDIIGISAAVIGVAAGILSQNGGLIASSLTAVIQTISSGEDKSKETTPAEENPGEA
jgi:hypothetical protein